MVSETGTDVSPVTIVVAMHAGSDDACALHIASHVIAAFFKHASNSIQPPPPHCKPLNGQVRDTTIGKLTMKDSRGKRFIVCYYRYD